MENFNLKELWELWQKGKSINDAIDTFLDRSAIKKQVRKKLKDLKKISTVNESGFLGECKKEQQNSRIFSEYKQEIFQQLYKKIESRELLVIGYKEPIGGTDTADLIPQKYWPHKEISLEDSSITFQEAKFSNIRINVNPKRNIDFSEYDSESSSPGRTTLEEELNRAYDYLYKNNQINLEKDFKSHINKIRKAIFHLYPDKFEGKSYSEKRKNLSDKTIQKHLSARFQREKKEYKAKNL